MNIIARQYRIYKDRFLLSVSISLLIHIIAIYIYSILPTPEKKVVLRPISLGVLQTKDYKEQMNKQTNTQQNEQQTKQTNQIKEIPIQKNQINQSNPVKIEQDKPSTDIDLQKLSVPQNGNFNPFASPKPSLMQSIKEKQENAKLENLPKVLQDELVKLYGTELQKMTKEEKDYIAESYFLNGEVFQQTANRMGYPKLAAYLKQKGRGIIEFTLYPDGHIDNIKIIKSTNYEALDDSMREVVELSAKNLKRPPKPIRIRLGGNYDIREY